MLMRATLGIVAILVLGAFAGCGDDDKGTNNGGTKIPSELEGTWILDSAIVDGQGAALRILLFWQENTVSARMTIKSEGLYLYEELDSVDSVIWADTGTFSVNGNSFIWETDNPFVKSGTWEVSGNKLIIRATFTYLGQPHQAEIFATK